MNKKNKEVAKELSLLENPNMETQVKEKSYRVVLRVLYIIILFSLLIFGYVFKFTVDLFPRYFASYCTGTFSASSFYDARDCDLIVFDKYSKKTDINVGDIVVYSSNLGEGSGKVVKYSHGVLEISSKSGDIKSIADSTVVGKQIKTVALLGFFVEFICSYYGIAVFNLLLIAYIAYLTFSRINYENTAHGKFLYKKFRKSQKEEKYRLKLLRKIKGIDDINYVVVSMLEGDFDQNKEKFLNFNKETKTSLKEKYKYILRSVHDAYLPNKDLTREEKKHISSVIELVCVCEDLDMDIEYMVVDLLLKTSLVQFDTENFVVSAIKFLESELDDDDLLNFGSILYVLTYKNKKLINDDIKKLTHIYLEKANQTIGEDRSVVVNTAKSLMKLIK